ncbi:MAG TPA: nucleoside 2-deoxyribosyltransferase [Smithellaceae bacterium]|nr:nucleoside 2-deoxyribosyltransferase [Smithellaceae bacterium]
MKIYFAGSIRAGRDDTPIYASLIDKLKKYGDVLTEHVGDKTLLQTGDDGPSDRSIHTRDMAWLQSCDCVVAEVTTPSLGVGYELGWAAALDKPVLCLYRSATGRMLSVMIAGSPAISTIYYSCVEDALPFIEDFIKRVAERRVEASGT